MIIDFHSHVKISKKSTFMPDYFREMMAEAKQNGLTALALTEHFNTSRFMDIYHFLDANYTYVNGYYEVDGLKLFPGVEVDVCETGHILLIGSRANVIAVREQLTGNLTKEQFIAFDQLMDLADQYDLLKIGGHPYRDSTPLARNVSRSQLQRLDALDLNGKDLYAKGVDACKEELQQLADEILLPIVGGSDTHQFLQYGSILNHFSVDCETSEQLKHAIQKGQYQVQISEQLPLKVKSATLVKKYMKKYLKETEIVSM
ncbi:PHP domain-containing protein [Gracilibacillus caseinilyticus]|uniref:PHP domain-containing protein n=1 Tax=Gracilibacillus caseinilyticus TaxID=2932256 RepID=A0ABY4EQQ7_9BACI|nr:PHP domain-containing protein [Gracilibacillus caseinilyticus]UOQ46695.1 PHP domain-containing protein [Gracilibacillus caseinilyticus]